MQEYISQYKKKLSTKMDNIVKSLHNDLSTISTGRASPTLLDKIKVEAYGSSSPIKELANITTSGSSSLLLQIWDKSLLPFIRKAINEANIGLTPIEDGNNIRINIPKLSQERRIELVKLTKKYGEDKKISLRNARRDILNDIKKNKEFSKDQIHELSEIIQDITDEYNKKISDITDEKEGLILKN